MHFSAIQTTGIDEHQLSVQLKQAAKQAGAFVTFTGCVRDFSETGTVDGLELEHYPGMTETALQELAEASASRFGCICVGIVHRVGLVLPTETIVWVGVAGTHRKEAFKAAMFAMDALKQTVPLWKKEWSSSNANWVASKQSDTDAFANWK